MDVTAGSKASASMALACVVLVGTVTIARGRQTVCARMDVLVMEFVKRRPASVIVILDGLVRDVKNKWTAQCLVIKRVVGTVCASTAVATVVQVTKSIPIVEHQTLVQEMTKVSCVIVMVCV
jgi:hypothetical protein